MMNKLFLVLVIGLVAFLSAVSQAAVYGGGSGTQEDPYQIMTAEQMNTIGLNSDDWDKYFVLMADIDMSAYTGTQYNIIGNAVTKFTGTFDGNGYVIANLSYATSNATTHVGLFGYLGADARINYLGLDSISIVAPNANSVGGLAGATELGALITGCYTAGAIEGNSQVGGLVGTNNGAATACYSNCSIQGQNNVGGLIGYDTGVIVICYACGAVSGNTNTGGLVGNRSGGTVNSSFWDMDTSGQATSAGGTGKTTLQMKSRAMFVNAGWDFVGETVNGSNDFWKMSQMTHYPILSWQKEVVYPDFNGDSMEDLLWRNVKTGEYLFSPMGVDPNGLLEMGTTESLGGSRKTSEIKGIADFNGDKKSDILWRNVKTGAFWGSLMNGSTAILNQDLAANSKTLQIIGFVDLNADGKTDLVWREIKTGAYQGWLMDGLTVQAIQSLGGSKKTVQIAGFADLNADGMSDIIWRNVKTGAYQGTLMDGLAVTATGDLGGTTRTIQIAGFADLNADGMSDIIWRNVKTGAYQGALMEGLTVATTGDLGGTTRTIQIAGFADFNADGMSDIVWRNVKTGAYEIALMDGLSVVGTENIGGGTRTIQIAGFADFNADGMSDIIWRNVKTGAYQGVLMEGVDVFDTLDLGGSTRTQQIVN